MLKIFGKPHYALKGALLVLAATLPAAAQDPNPALPVAVQAQNWFQAGGEYQEFRRDLAAWTLFSIEAGHRGQQGAVMARFNRADRFSESGTQVEIDAYPKFGSRAYAYLNVGKSDSAIFPKWRWGAELFNVFGGGIEASAGARYLQFASSTMLYTGSLGRYWGNYWASLRPYVVAGPSQTTTSAGVTVRRYFATADDYASFAVSAGKAPRDPILAREAGVSNWDVSASGRRQFGTTFVQGGVGLQSQDVGAPQHRRSTIVRLAVGRRF
jgi:YaiO family outer membrane protein